MKTTILAAALLFAVLAASVSAWAQCGYEIFPSQPGLPTFVTPNCGNFFDFGYAQRQAVAASMNALTNNMVLELFQAEIARNQLQAEQRAAQAQLQAEQRAKLQRAMAVVRANMPVSDAEIKAYYDAHSGDFTSPERYRLAVISVVYPPNAPAKLVAAARAKAEALRELVLSGEEDFATVAREYSENRWASRGGELGFYIIPSRTPRSMLDAARPLFDAIAPLKAGQISRVIPDPIPPDPGFDIVKVEEHDLPRLEPLSAVKDQIREKVADQKTLAYFEWAAKEAASGTASGANW
jgi:parvulin-like peptidyl-prolyl isomerase